MAQFSSPELREFLDDLFEKIEFDAKLYNRQDEFEVFLSRYNLDSNTAATTVMNYNAKILILGTSSGSVSNKDIAGIFSRADLKGRFELISYDELSQFDIRVLEYNSKYSDIFIGPVPHKVKGMGDTENFVEKLMSGSGNIYPRAQKLKSGDGLKITKSNLTHAITNSSLINNSI